MSGVVNCNTRRPIRLALALGAALSLSSVGCTSNSASGPSPLAASTASAEYPPGYVDTSVPRDERTQLLVEFLKARVNGKGAEVFTCCKAARRIEVGDTDLLYSFGERDLVDYRIIEWHERDGDDPFYIASMIYEGGGVESMIGEFLIVGEQDGMLRVKQWAREGTS